MTFDQVVVLHDGTVYRCAVFERVPNAHYRLVLPTGEVRTIPWGDVASVRPYQARPAPAPEPTVGTPMAPATELPPLLRGVVVPRGELRGRIVRLTAADSHPLMVGVGYGRGGFEPLCTLPCTLRLETGMHTLTFTGPGIREYSAPVNTRRGDLDVVARTPTRGTFAAGLTLLLVGVAAVLSGIALVAVGTSTSDTLDEVCRDRDFSCDTGTDDTMTTFGVVFGIVGFVMGIGGTALLGSNTSGVEITPR